MAYKDLREFLSVLEKNGQLLRITEPVLPEPDIASAACAGTKLGDQSPALLFENIKGYKTAKIAMNVHASWPNHALAIGMAKDTPLKDQFFEFVKRYQTYPGKIERRADAPWKEVVVDKDINLYDLMPLFRLNQGDGGFYIDKSTVVSRDLNDWDNINTQNCGMYRLEVKGRNRIGIQPVPEHDIAIHLARAEEQGKDLPIAICLGNDPLMSIVSGMPILYDQSEYEMAGALQGEPYRIATTELTGLDVPWGSEFVLEGKIRSRVREAEGPFGEFTGHYSGGRNMPVIEV
jgi:UbiD family decarboxylase